MQYIVHGVNSKEKLENLSHDVGIEVDIRYRNEKLVLGHDLDDTNDIFEEFLKIYDNTLFVANIKDTGIEELVIKKIKENNINNFFLLDVEFPFIIKNYKKYGSHLSTRFSEFCAAQTFKFQRNFVQCFAIFPVMLGILSKN